MGHVTTSTPESHINPNVNIHSPPQPTKAKQETIKRQPKPHPQASVEPKTKRKDKPSQSPMHLTERKQAAQLVGKKCLVWFRLNNIKTQALWDTGAQVSIMSEAWKSDNLPDAKICPISDLLSDDELLDLRAANGLEIPFEG